MNQNVRNRLFLLSSLPGILILLSGCDSKEYDQVSEENQQLEFRVRELKDQNEVYRLELSDMRYAMNSMSRLQDKETELLSEINDIRTYKETLESALLQVNSQIGPWKETIRETLIGREIGPISSPEAGIIARATIREVGEERVLLSYEGGEKEFEIEKLPREIRLLLGHEPSILFELKMKPETQLQ